MMKTENRIRVTEFPKLLKTQGKHNDGGSLYLVVRGGSCRWEYQIKEGGKVTSKWGGSAVGPLAVSLSDARTWRNLKKGERYLARRNGTMTAVVGPPQGRPAAAGKTFAEALTAWLAANPTAWAAKGVTARRGLASLSLASLDVGKITQADVLDALKNETPRQHAEKRGWIKALFSYAKAQGWRAADSENPADFDADTRDGFAEVPESEHFAALTPDALPAVLKALPDTEAGNAVRFCLLTAARPGAVEAATWSQIKGDNGTSSWEYIIKKGYKLFLQRVPLTKAALALIGERGAADAPLFVLKANQMRDTFKASAGDAPTMDGRKAQLHGTARSTFKGWCDDQEDPVVEDTLSEAALGHYKGDKVHRAYSRGDLFDRRRKLMDDWSAFTTSLTTSLGYVERYMDTLNLRAA